MPEISIMGFPLNRGNDDDLTTVRKLLDGPAYYMASKLIENGVDLYPKAIILTGDRQLMVDFGAMFGGGNDPNKQVWLNALKRLCYTYKAYAIIKLIHGYIKTVPDLKDYDPDKSVKEQGGMEAIIADVELSGDRYFSTKAVIKEGVLEAFEEFKSVNPEGGIMSMKLLPNTEDPILHT